MTQAFDSNSSDELKTSMSLVRMAQASDQDAWHRLVATYTPLIRLWCITKGVRGVDICDCCQDVFFRASRRLPYFDKKTPQHSFRGWLRTITKAAIKDHYRKKYRDKQIFPGGSSAIEVFANVADNVSSDSLSTQLRRSEKHLLAQSVIGIIKRDFSNLQTKAFFGVVMHQRKPGDVAQDLKTTVNYVYKAKCHILARIRKLYPNPAL